MKKTGFILLLFVVSLSVGFSAPTRSPEEACGAFLAANGWEMADAFTISTALLPRAEDPAWQAYLALQRENGFFMEPFCGETVLRLSCPLKNHPRGAAEAHFYWHEGRIVGGDILSPALDGFMHGLLQTRI